MILLKKVFWTSTVYLKILFRIYVRPDLHRVGHLVRLVTHIYFKASVTTCLVWTIFEINHPRDF